MRSAMLLGIMLLFDLGLFALSGLGVIFGAFAMLMGNSSPALFLFALSVAGLVAAVLFGLRVILPAMRETARDMRR